MDSTELGVEGRRALHGRDYAERFEADQDPRRIANILEALDIPPGIDVLDVGCGNALSLEFLLKSGMRRYTGVDFSADLLEYARARAKRAPSVGFPEIRFFQGSVGEVLAKFGSGWVDLALGLDVSEHVYDEEWVAACEDVHRSLKPGGRFVLHTPNASFFLERMKKRDFIVKQFPEHIAVRNARENERLLNRAGFRRIETRVIPHYNSLRVVHPLALLPGLRGFFGARLLIIATKDET